MLEYLFESRDEEGRDLLSELDAGELDEEYVAKHAHDYTTHAVRLFVASKDMAFLLIARMVRWFGRERPVQSAKTRARTAVP